MADASKYAGMEALKRMVENTVSLVKSSTSAFVGATTLTDGVQGTVPKPLIADKDKFLKADGTWANPESIGDETITNLFKN